MRPSLHRLKRILLIITISLVLASCRSSVPVVHASVVQDTHNSERIIIDHRTDSVYLFDSVIVYKDSLIEKWRTRYISRNSIKHDTIITRDTTIVDKPYPVETVVYAQTWVQQRLSRVGALLLIALSIWLVSKLNWKSIITSIINLIKK